MKILVAISAAILMVSKGQILTQPPPQVSVISPSSPWLWYPTFSPGSVSLRTDLGSCPDDMIQASKNHERAGTILTQAKRIQKWLGVTNKKKTNAATMFDGGLKALRHWTANGTKCSNVKYGGTALSTLANCSTSATKNCDSSRFDRTLLPYAFFGDIPCIADAERIVESYYVSTCLFFKLSSLSPNPHLPAIRGDNHPYL